MIHWGRFLSHISIRRAIWKAEFRALLFAMPEERPAAELWHIMPARIFTTANLSITMPILPAERSLSAVRNVRWSIAHSQKTTLTTAALFLLIMHKSR